jgi:hypothetical protein
MKKILKENIIDKFPTSERGKRKALHSLMNDWVHKVSKCEIKYRGKGKKYSGIDCFSSDGFFPNYYNQDIKVLFIGREARKFDQEQDFIERFVREFKTENFNEKIFWRRVLKVIYGISNCGKIQFKDVISATEISRKISVSNNLSFAIMNFSKFYNESIDAEKADYKLINKFIEESELDKRNYFFEELELLNPDIIITANLWNGKIKDEYLNTCFNSPKKISKGKKIDIFEMKLNNKDVTMIDTFHFSCPGSDKLCYYDPIMKYIKGIK